MAILHLEERLATPERIQKLEERFRDEYGFEAGIKRVVRYEKGTNLRHEVETDLTYGAKNVHITEFLNGPEGDTLRVIVTIDGNSATFSEYVVAEKVAVAFLRNGATQWQH